MKTKDLFDLSKTISASLLERTQCPWEILGEIREFVITLGKTLANDCFEEVYPQVWIAKTAEISSSAHIDGPCIIDENAVVRHSAFIRGSVIVGKNCVVGNSTEMKNSIIFDEVQIPHYNYVGDSVLGYRAHLGAGAITSNVKSDKTPVTIKYDEGKIETGLKKFGAMVGDFVEIGCNSVLCPGTVIGRNSTVYPLSRVRGYLEGNSIYKGEDNIVSKI